MQAGRYVARWVSKANALEKPSEAVGCPLVELQQIRLCLARALSEYPGSTDRVIVAGILKARPGAQVNPKPSAADAVGDVKGN